MRLRPEAPWASFFIGFTSTRQESIFLPPPGRIMKNPRIPSTAFLRWSWQPLVAILLVLSLEAGLLDRGWLRREPLILMTLPAAAPTLRYGSAEVDIHFGEWSWPSTLNVSLTRTGSGRTEGEIDVTHLFLARENGAVGDLTSLTQGRYTLRARVFGHPCGRKDRLIEEDVSIDLVVPALPEFDRA